MSYVVAMLCILFLQANEKNARGPDDGKDPVEEFRAEVKALLANLGPDLKDKEPNVNKEEILRGELSQIIDKYSPKLRPARGSKRYVSKDKVFVLVIAANAGINETKGANAEAVDPQAHLVVAIGGDGSPGLTTNGGAGGQAVAKAAKGVALAIGGRGGMARGLNPGAGGLGGGGGGGSGAEGSTGSISLGGPGGKGFKNGADGGTGGGDEIVNPEAIRRAMRKQ